MKENLLPGNLGHFFAILSFVFAVITTIAYYKSSQNEDPHWKSLGRIAFILHSTSILLIFIILGYLIFTHRFEYYYVWSHSSKTLPFKYLLACFWEGQEGSFLLWMFWHGILGLILMNKAGRWEAPVMAVVGFVEIFLSATILGFVFGELKIGTSPFTLLKHQMAGAPIFQQNNYLDFIQDGNGLNPLLQNYWMVIHPPILFLGFASTLIPFAYTIAALWKKHVHQWVMPTLAWSIFGVAVLGAGIMMGGAWAYESLSFGGYWAWDPVENASLVPWLILVGGVHTLNIFKNTNKYSLKSAFWFLILTFFLVLYSTYLTRTGILGETSVHAFTGEGAFLNYHLVIFLAAILIGSLVLYFKNQKYFPQEKEEEKTWSREFWMYLGSLVLMISAIQITFTTSIPVWNKLFGLTLAPPADPMTHYNRVQIWIAILITIGTAYTFYLKYKDTDMKKAMKSQLVPFILSLLCALFIGYNQKINEVTAIILLVAVCYGVIGNIAYLIKINTGKILKWSAMLAHSGFALLLLGILLSSFNKRVVSFNKLSIDLGLGSEKDDAVTKAKENRENILLFINTPVDMNGYKVTYKGDSVVPPNHFYKINYERRDPKTDKLLEKFTLYPNAQINPKMGLVSSPGTKHYWNKDIFTYVTKIKERNPEDSLSYTRRTMKVNDTLYFGNGLLVYRGLNTRVTNPNYSAQSGDIAVSAILEAYGLEGKVGEVSPVYLIRGNREMMIEDTLKDYQLYTRLVKLNMDENKSIDLEFTQPAAQNEYVVMKALEFPHINVVWLGTIVMIIGTLMSFFKRWKQINSDKIASNQ